MLVIGVGEWFSYSLLGAKYVLELVISNQILKISASRRRLVLVVLDRKT